MSALEQDPLGTFSRVLGPEDQKKKRKNEKKITAPSQPKVAEIMLKLTLVMFWKSRRDTSALMIMISLLDT